MAQQDLKKRAHLRPSMVDNNESLLVHLWQLIIERGRKMVEIILKSRTATEDQRITFYVRLNDEHSTTFLVEPVNVMALIDNCYEENKLGIPLDAIVFDVQLVFGVDCICLSSSEEQTTYEELMDWVICNYEV